MKVDWSKPIEVVTPDHQIKQARYVGTLENSAYPRIISVFLHSPTHATVLAVKEDGYISTALNVRNKVNKFTKWINVYCGPSPHRDDGDKQRHPGVCFWDTEQEAKEGMQHPSYVKTIKVECEE